MENVHLFTCVVQALECRLMEESVITDDIRHSLEAERKSVSKLSSELSCVKRALVCLKCELQTTQTQLSNTSQSLVREENHSASITSVFFLCFSMSSVLYYSSVLCYFSFYRLYFFKCFLCTLYFATPLSVNCVLDYLFI